MSSKHETGLTPPQYLKQLRIRKAKEYLENTFLSIKEIRREIGATDESHFIRDFKKVYGVPPARLRTRVGDEESGAAGASNLDGQIGQQITKSAS